MANKPAIADVRARIDGWNNIMTQLGREGYDKRLSGRFERTVFVSQAMAEDMWLGDDIIARIIELPPLTRWRNGVKVSIAELDPKPNQAPYVQTVTYDAVDKGSDELKQVEEETNNIIDDLNAVGQHIEADQWSRAYGGCGQYLGVDDGQSPEKPINEKAVKALRYIINLRPGEIWPVQWNTDPVSPNFAQPTMYRVQREANGAQATSRELYVHASRIMRFDGIKVSRRHSLANRGWGSSIIERLYAVVRDFNSSFDIVPVILSDVIQTTLEMDGFDQLMLSQDEEVVLGRLRMIMQGRGILNAAVVDKKDSLKRETANLAGIPEMLMQMTNRLVAGVGMPKSLLFGEDPAGLNATGEANVRWFYDEQKAIRELQGRRRWNRIFKLIFISKEGPTRGVEPARWKAQFGEMWLPTAGEVATIRKTTAEADNIYLQNGVVTPEELATSRFGGDEWSAETKLDDEARELQAEADATAPDEAEELLTPTTTEAPPPVGTNGKQTQPSRA